MRQVIIGLLGLTLLPALLQAAVVQYDVTTGRITGVSATAPDAVAGRALLTIPEAPDAIPWPPPSGCPAGDREWTLVVSNSLALRPDLVFFRCLPVRDKSDVDAVVEAIVDTHWSAFTGGLVNDLSMILALVANVRCPSAGINATCDNLRTQALAVNSVVGNNGQLLTALTQLSALLTEAANFKAAQCTAGNTAFCL